MRSSDPNDPKRVNVSVLEVGNQEVRVSVEMLGPTGAKAPTPEEVRAKILHDQNHLY